MALMLFRRLPEKLINKSGQATVEYAVVLAALLAVTIGLGALWSLFREGMIADHALLSASHHLAGDALGAALDVFAY